MNRDAFLIYLRDLRDLEFAKESLDTALTQGKDNYDGRVNFLKKTNYHYTEDLGLYVAGMIITIVIAFLCVLFVSKVHIPVFGPFIELACVVVVIGCIYGFFTALAALVRTAHSNRQIRAHNRKEDAIAEKHQKELSVLRNTWSSQSASLQKEFNKVDSLLKNGYSLNIIPAPYRNLASMYYIYDYMSTSRASFEDTLMHEHMENGIQRILSKLDTIIAQNEQLIFHARQQEAHNREMRQRTDQMFASLQRTEQNTLEGKQYAKINAQHTQTIAFFKEMEFWDNYSKRR